MCRIVIVRVVYINPNKAFCTINVGLIFKCQFNQHRRSLDRTVVESSTQHYHSYSSHSQEGEVNGMPDGCISFLESASAVVDGKVH
jgi:hypothetical protein